MLVKLKPHVTLEQFMDETFPYGTCYIEENIIKIKGNETTFTLEEFQNPHELTFLYSDRQIEELYEIVEGEVPNETTKTNP
jgi:hypothetical protein